MQGFGSLREAVCVRDGAQKHSKKSAYVIWICFNSKCTITPATKGFINTAVPVSAFSSKHHLDKSSFFGLSNIPSPPPAVSRVSSDFLISAAETVTWGFQPQNAQEASDCGHLTPKLGFTFKCESSADLNHLRTQWGSAKIFLRAFFPLKTRKKTDGLLKGKPLLCA